MKLEFKELTKKYGDNVALDKFSIVLENGVYGLLGPNGAGKSTLMNLITDNIKRTSGSILYDGKDILELGAGFRQKLGYMPQQQGIYGNMTAVEFLMYMSAIKGVKRNEAKKQTEHLLEVVNLSDAAGKKLAEFSGGMKQRVMLAQAVMNEPELIILDEPTAGLDPKERIRMRDFIKDLSENKIVILATHVVSDIEKISKEILLMKKGSLIQRGTPAELIKNVWEATGKEKTLEQMDLEDVYMYYLENNNSASK